MPNYLILKLSDKEKSIPFSDSKLLAERANGAWRFTPARLNGVNTALLLFRGQILEEYEIGRKITYDLIDKRITFDMSPVSHSTLKGKSLEYKTSNPASLVDSKKLQSLLR